MYSEIKLILEGVKKGDQIGGPYELSKILANSLQANNGFNKDDFHQVIKKKNFNGIDRIVPTGQALDISLNWDGYDIINILTKVIDVK